MVKYPTVVQGRIRGTRVNRQYHLFYPDGNTEQDFDFNAFTQPFSPAQQLLDEEEQHTLGLGQRLETGDIVSKAANSMVLLVLLVQRGDSLSRWFCSANPRALGKRVVN